MKDHWSFKNSIIKRLKIQDKNLLIHKEFKIWLSTNYLHTYYVQRSSKLSTYLISFHLFSLIFSVTGTKISVLHFWTSIEMRLKIESDDYHLYMGRNTSMVKKMHDDHMSSWFYHVLPWKSQVIYVLTC